VEVRARRETPEGGRGTTHAGKWHGGEAPRAGDAGGGEDAPPPLVCFFSFFHTIFFKKILAEFFYLDVHFSFLPFDKFLSVKIFLVKFF